MNKAAIKNFAIWARNKLIAEITYKAGLLGITEKGMKNPQPQSTNDVQFFDIGTKEPYSITGEEIEQRRNLVEIIQRKEKESDYKTTYKSVIEEVAYTWFNRLIAVRFMEVNDYLPSRIRVLSSESSSKIEPDLVTSPFEADLEFTSYENERIIQLKNDNKLDELFRMLFIKQCNALNAILPELFEKTNDCTELLMNVSFTDKDGVVYRLVHDIPEDDFNVDKEGQVEIIGWLYQYYNTEPKDETFALLKQNVKITKERIPAATQLFTPEWIVRYMVENSLGRLWIEGHPNNELKAGWKYYLDEAEQEPEVQEKLGAIQNEYKTTKPEDIRVIDPCMGSGHILVYAFDVLMQIYESYGYSQRDAARSIIENNLYGLDIDNRAYQLAYFGVMMKARQYNRRILDGKTNCHIYAIQDSNEVNRSHLKYFGNNMNDSEQKSALHQMLQLLDNMHDAKEYGSILNPIELDWDLLYHFVDNVMFDGQLTIDVIGLENTQVQLRLLVEIASVMSQRYNAVITNPPYMSISNGNEKLNDYVKKHYSDSKADLYAVFIDRCREMALSNAFVAMITQHSWMFLSSFETLRDKLLKEDVVSMLHLGARAFEDISGEVVQTTTFVLRRNYVENFRGVYSRLITYGSQLEKENAFLNNRVLYIAKTSEFCRIPGKPIAYWISETMINCFGQKYTSDYAKCCKGLDTGNNDLFLRYWYEVDYTKIKLQNGHEKWVPYNKGGSYRKWYGNNDYVVNWEYDGNTLSNFKGSNIRNRQYHFKEGVTWSTTTGGSFSCRRSEAGFLFDSKGCMAFPYNIENLNYLMACMNSKVYNEFLSIITPTLDFNPGPVSRAPMIICDSDSVDSIVDNCVSIAKEDWDAFECSWGFVRHPLLKYNTASSITSAFNEWQQFSTKQFQSLKENEEVLNRLFINAFKLQNEITSSMEEKEITIRKADLARDIRSFISYAIGCMFGRYSLDVEGLVYAGGKWDVNKYSTFIPDKDNIIPITDEEYFEDDVVGLFCAFLKKSFGVDTFEENLNFIAKALGSKGNTPKEVIRNYFLKDFFKDHCKIYQKRPIYWLFDSGKEDGFKALIYLHRYNENTIGNLRIDYLHLIQRVYDREIARMQETIDNSSNAREVAAANKRKEKLTKQLKETKEYDEKIAHLALVRISIDLDDGVKVNYDKIQTGSDRKKLDILAKI
ncbi:BREX-1 system adenine-specific DNA-methyltransferase PglX [Paenibacillus mesophilus]|uniref:BREX-1 system adenine-specific DNA-methyltransferase PglX n=1 Tax=Paenibacillus mesophilus TaxID=2582849 RepID=UPI00110D47D3|nr:BREX-1 system adenine-specific DNA-methyltransferase PglX [Paenibacillus mesophilus]TMV47045.1 BREX-1 system adenine-specific DNA-methyltransferase PglX [Paenibacillus mesophilus]